MKNISKTTKTIVFASLIAAMILPFSGMMMAEAAPNENANDKAKETKKYRVDVLSTEILEESVVNGVKITKLKHTIKPIDKYTMKDFKDDNKDYFEFLRNEGGEAGNKLVGQAIAEFAKSQKNDKEQYEIEVMKYGDQSISFESVTRDGASFSANIKDPINFVYHDDARPTEIRNVIDYNAPDGWKNAWGGTQYVYVDESIHGGIAYFHANAYQFEEGSYFSDRVHTRIFEGGDDTHGSFDYWSIGSTHEEWWNGSGHTLYQNTWETTEDHLISDLTGTSGVGSISSIYLGNSGGYGSNPSSYNDGYAAYIQIQ